MSNTWLDRYIPILYWLPRYPKAALRSDLIAGLTSAAVVIPQAMAYAAIAGLPIEAGVYAAFAPALAYAVLGTSRPLSVSTTSTIAILTAASLAKVAPGGAPGQLMAACATLTLLVGIILALAGVL